MHHIFYGYRSKMGHIILYFWVKDYNMLLKVYKCHTIIYYDLTLVI